MKPGNLAPADFPAHHPEWVQRDHMLIAWALVQGGWMTDAMVEPDMIDFYHSSGGADLPIDPFGIPIPTPELRKRLGDEWRKWKDSQP